MHKFEPGRLELLLSAERLREVPPEETLRASGLREGHVFADIGCGPGFFTIPASGVVGKSGKVFAVDTQEEMLRELKKRNPPQNVVIVKSEENSVPIEGATVDLALLAYVLHEAEDKRLFLKEVKRLLKKGGTLLVLDWKKKKEEKGPPIEERLTAHEVEEILRGSGFVKVKSSTLNPSHYRVLATKA